MKDGSEGGSDAEDVVAAEVVKEVGAESSNEVGDELEMAVAADMKPQEHVIEAA